MKLSRPIIKLICELESIIGNECYNPNSLNGFTLEEGCSFRYPVTYVDKDDKECKTKSMIRDMDKDRLDSIHYKFGSNQLEIGHALVKVLETLERKYDLNFDELVKRK